MLSNVRRFQGCTAGTKLPLLCVRLASIYESRISQNWRKLTWVLLVKFTDAEDKVGKYGHKECCTDKDGSDDSVEVTWVSTSDEGHSTLVKEVAVGKNGQAYQCVGVSKFASDRVLGSVKEGSRECSHEDGNVEIGKPRSFIGKPDLGLDFDRRCDFLGDANLDVGSRYGLVVRVTAFWSRDIWDVVYPRCAFSSTLRVLRKGSESGRREWEGEDVLNSMGRPANERRGSGREFGIVLVVVDGGGWSGRRGGHGC